MGSSRWILVASRCFAYRRPCSIGNCDEEEDQRYRRRHHVLLRRGSRVPLVRPNATTFFAKTTGGGVPFLLDDFVADSRPALLLVLHMQIPIARRIDYPRLQSWPCTFTRCTLQPGQIRFSTELRCTRHHRRSQSARFFPHFSISTYAPIIKMHQRWLFCSQRVVNKTPYYLSKISGFVRG